MDNVYTPMDWSCSDTQATPEERDIWRQAYEKAFPLFVYESGGAPRRATPEEISGRQKIQGMKSDYVIMDDPMEADTWGANIESLANRALMFGSAMNRIEADGTVTEIDVAEEMNKALFLSELHPPSARHVYTSQFPDSVFNPTADVRGFAARLIDTSD